MALAVGSEIAVVKSSFRADVLAGLAAPHKEIPCKYFYDEAGSDLFEQICGLTEYYLTRAELAIMQRHAAAMANVLGQGCLLIEYGSGSSLKTRYVLDHLVTPAAYVPVDISSGPLASSARLLARRYPNLDIRPLCADFARDLQLPCSCPPARRRVVYFPGSTIGNFTPDEAALLLAQTAQLCGPRGALLLGVDLKKDPQVLHAAYNDAAGVTAAFNLNLLARVNRELGADFDLGRFAHYAFYQPREGRIEMHLLSRVAQRVRVAGQSFSFAAGESIRTEYSYKYSVADLQQLAATGGFQLDRVWYDDERAFGVAYLTVARA
jgi:dimethylhistidine N-methyltransferase